MPAWLDFMPAIPLAKAVPMTHRGGDRGLDRVTQRPHMHIEGSWWCCVGATTPNYRVDLADPQGMGYALRKAHELWVLGTDGAESARRATEWSNWLYRWTYGRTTELDRFDLARALAEVTP